MSHVQSYRAIVFVYAALGVALALLFLRLSASVEVSPVSNGSVASLGVAHIFGIARSRNVVLKLSGLFALDSFAGGFVVQSFAAYWFYLRFGVQPAALGAIFFWANVFAGISAPHRFDSHHGCHPSAVECSAHPRAIDAQPLMDSGGASSPVQH
jgi:hypothetical protein